MEPIVIRSAVLWDLFWIEGLGRQGLNESGQLYPAYDLGHMLKGFIDSIEQGLVYVAADGDSIVGALIVGVTSWPQSPRHQMLTNEHLYVLPEFRARKTADGKHVGIALMDVLIDASDRGKIPILLRNTFGKDPELMGKLAERKGFKPIGGTYLYQPEAKLDERAA